MCIITGAKLSQIRGNAGEMLTIVLPCRHSTGHRSTSWWPWASPLLSAASSQVGTLAARGRAAFRRSQQIWILPLNTGAGPLLMYYQAPAELQGMLMCITGTNSDILPYNIPKPINYRYNITEPKPPIMPLRVPFRLLPG